MTDQTPPAIADSTAAPEPAAAATEPVPIAEPEPVAALPAAVESAPAEPVAAVPLDAPRHGSWSRPGRLGAGERPRRAAGGTGAGRGAPGGVRPGRPRLSGSAGSTPYRPAPTGWQPWSLCRAFRRGRARHTSPLQNGRRCTHRHPSLVTVPTTAPSFPLRGSRVRDPSGRACLTRQAVRLGNPTLFANIPTSMGAARAGAPSPPTPSPAACGRGGWRASASRG